MQKTLKKSISILLSLLLVLSVFGGMAFTASAATIAVTFDPANGDSATTVNIEPGAIPTRPDDPEREGCMFKGWKFGDAYKYYDFATR